MRNTIEGFKFHDVGEQDSSNLFVFVEYNTEPPRIVYSLCGKDRETHTYIHEMAMDEDIIESLEPIGGGVLYIHTGDQRPSFHYGNATEKAWSAVERFSGILFEYEEE